MENENKDQELANYIARCLEEKIPHDEIKKQLQAVGWSEDEADFVYSKGLVKAGVPTPDKNNKKSFSKKSTAVEIVINLFSFILLGILAVSLGILFYQVINHNFPDNLRNYYGYYSTSGTIHYAIAALIISFPLYFLSMRFWFLRFREDEGRAESSLTKWITYLVLLVAAVTVVGDLIAVIFDMLQGEITARFFLKSLTIFGIAGGIFGFYFLERKKIQYKKLVSERIFFVFGWMVLIIVLVAIVLGFLASGSPKAERMRNFDITRSSDLQTLASCVNEYSADYKTLPENLNNLKDNSRYSYCGNKKDPETNLPYEYNIINKNIVSEKVVSAEFELCANFSLASMQDNKEPKYEYYEESGHKWLEHGAGRSCDKENVIIEKNNDFNLNK